jgi:hypothetical protein
MQRGQISRDNVEHRNWERYTQYLKYHNTTEKGEFLKPLDLNRN